MNYELQLILEKIKQELICLVDGKEMGFSNGNEAICILKKDGKHYSLADISAINNVVVVEMKDISKDIKEKIDEFATDYKKHFGCELSFF